MSKNNSNSSTFTGIKNKTRKIGASYLRRQAHMDTKEKPEKAFKLRPKPLPTLDEAIDAAALRGYWDCKSLEEVQALQGAQQDELISLAEKAVKGPRNRKLGPQRKGKQPKKPIPNEFWRAFDAILHRSAFCGDLNLIDKDLLKVAHSALHANFMAWLKGQEDGEAVFVTIIDGRNETSSFVTTIDLQDSTARARYTLSKISKDYIAIHDKLLFNNKTHDLEGRIISPHIHAIVVGKDVVRIAKAVAADHASRYAPNCSGARAIDVCAMSLDEVNVARVLGYMMKPPYVCGTIYKKNDDSPANIHHSRKSDRSRNYLRLVQLRSLITWDQAIFAGGHLGGVRKAALGVMQAHVSAATRLQKPKIHRDAVQNEWSDLFQRLEYHSYRLPFIKLRK